MTPRDTDIPAIPDGYMRNAQGALIPVETIKPQDLLEDELVGALIEKARALNNALAEFKAHALDQAAAFKATIAQEYGATRGGAAGNMTLTSFDGRLRVKVQVSQSVSFGPGLMAAKELIDSCIERWSEGANANIRALVDQAFQVNKVGRIDTHRVLALRRLDMVGADGQPDAEWQTAMQAIADALRVDGSRTYVRFYHVDPKTERETAIPLDLANV